MSATRKTLDLLRRYESRNVTFMPASGGWPIVWDRARGVQVWDAEGKRYLDLTAAFGVAAAGHANPRVVRAGQKQMARLLHAMGDVHPHAGKARLARELSAVTFERWHPSSRSPAPTGKSIFCNSGSEAVEAALKTAMLATGRPGVIAFHGAYHGLGYGALNATQRDHFRSPFRKQLKEFARFVPYPTGDQISLGPEAIPPPGPTFEEFEDHLTGALRTGTIGAVLVEPMQARGGIHIPSPGFLPLLRRRCDEHGALLIFDEIYTGFGRTGRWFACEHTGVAPDLICLGKALTGGFPMSACVGRADLMDAAWPLSTGEAIHTSTFLGHPVGCAMALAQIAEIRSAKLVERSAELGVVLLENLRHALAANHLPMFLRGVGLFVGLDLRLPGGRSDTARSLRAMETMLARGFILLPEGEHSNVLSFTPPLTISAAQLRRTVAALASVLAP